MALGFFVPSGDPNVDMETRRKIAMAMMARGRKAFPKNLGEGIASVGQEIGDYLAERGLLAENAAANVAGDKALEKYTGGERRTEAEPDQRTTYAPPDSMPPAVAAINAAAPQGPPIVPVPPPQARIVTPSTAPSGGAAPVAAGPGGMVEPGAFNEIDAADPRNRYRAPPAYLAPALERNIVDPERRGYLGQLAGKEAQSAGEVSPTGAAGPFQFTRGTGAQYGIPGNARFDPNASTLAANALTNDNVAALTAKLGREPTSGEMALAHQQGAGTAGNMLTGQGNAPARNLAVNNVPPGMGPGAAADKIMSYYGMPGAAGVPASPRDAVAAAVTGQQRPAVADYGQKLALAATPQQAIPAAPPQQQVRAAPQQQVAQAQPTEGQPGYVPPSLQKPVRPPQMTDIQRSILQDIQAAPPAIRENVEKRLMKVYGQEQLKVDQWNSNYTEDVKRYDAREELRQKSLVDQAERAQKAEELRQKNVAGQHVTVDNRLMIPDPNKPIGSPWIEVTAPKPGQKGDGPPVLSKPLTAEQDHSQKFLTQMVLAEKQLEGKEHLLANSPGQAILGKFGGNALMNRNYLTAKNAADFSVAANLRDVSGATIQETEQVRQYRMSMPVLGDPPSEIAAKRERRKAIMDSMYNGLGDARQLVDYAKQEMIKRQETEQAKINEVMNTRLGSKPKGYVAQNKKTGENRVFDGQNWVDYTP